MKYMGSKRRIAKHVAPIIQAHIDSGQFKTYIEPFVGGANMMEHIVCDNRCGSDVNKYLIALLERMQQSELFTYRYIKKDEYAKLRAYRTNGDPAITTTYPHMGWVGICCSYNGKWFGGFAGEITTKINTRRNYQEEAYRELVRQSPLIKDVQFTCHSYKNWAPENCVVYCDPPYAGTTKYKTGDFDHADFWRWCKRYAEPQYNNTILVSEYNAPEGVECIWSKEINSSLTKDTGSKKGVEKLFWVK